MIICVGCKREMRVDKNGVGADYGQGHVYASDRWVCPECGAMVLNCNGLPCHDPEYKKQDQYLKIRHGEELRRAT